MVWKPKKKKKWEPDWEKMMERKDKVYGQTRNRKQEDKQSIKEGIDEYESDI